MVRQRWHRGHACELEAVSVELGPAPATAHDPGTPPGAVRVQLGPIERWIVGLSGLVLVSVCGWFANSTMARLDKLGEQQAEIQKQQAVGNAQMLGLATQLAGLQSLTDRVTTLEAKVEAHTDEIDRFRRNEARLP